MDYFCDGKRGSLLLASIRVRSTCVTLEYVGAYFYSFTQKFKWSCTTGLVCDVPYNNTEAMDLGGVL